MIFINWCYSIKTDKCWLNIKIVNLKVCALSTLNTKKFQVQKCENSPID